MDELGANVHRNTLPMPVLIACTADIRNFHILKPASHCTDCALFECLVAYEIIHEGNSTSKACA